VLLEEFRQKYILPDGQVTQLACAFESRQVQVQLNIRKRKGRKLEPCEIIILFNEATEIDLLGSFGVSSYSDVVFVKTDSGEYYASFDPLGNSGEPGDNDNFVIKSREVVVFDGDEEFRLE
jgi:hypothetical protein